MNDEIRYQVDDGLAVITLNRPDALNALTFQMLGDFRIAVDEARADDAVTAIAVTGNGRAFCSGADISMLSRHATGAESSSKSDYGAQDGDPPALFSYLTRIPKPVFAAINGVAAGGGFVLAMMCDMRFAAEDASLTTIFSKRGLIAEHGLSWLLPRQIGLSRALDLLFSSRRVSAIEALSIGLVDNVVPKEKLLEEISDYTQKLRANVAPRSIAMIKAQCYRQLSMSMAPAMEECDLMMREALAHPDAQEGAASFVDRRAPQFSRIGDLV